MAGIKDKACIPSTAWNRLRKLYGNERIDYYNLLEDSYLAARRDGTLHERKNRELRYRLLKPAADGKWIEVKYTPNEYREKNPQWIWCLQELSEVTEKPKQNGQKKQKVKLKTKPQENGKGKVREAEKNKEKQTARKTERKAAETNGKNGREQRVKPVANEFEEEAAPNDALKQFAWLGPESEFYTDLYNMMMNDPWYFSTDEKLISLASYINYTFYRLQTEGKIVRSIDDQYTAFNTGLVDDRDNEIYALFARETGYRQDWVYKAFCIRGTGDGKVLSEKFVEFPAKADYELDPRLLQIGKDADLDVDFQHIVIANAGRLPEEMLVDESDKETKSPLKNILEQRRRLNALGQSEGVAEQNYKIGKLIAEHDEFRNRLLDRLEEQINMARNRVHQNPAVAIPVYYPGKNTMSVILPLYRSREDDIAYGALVVGITPAGNYQAHTLLTPRMAYVDARIVRPIDSLWLMKAYVQATGKPE